MKSYGGKVAEELFENGSYLPSGSNLTDEERERIAKKIKEVFSKITKTTPLL